MAGVLWSEMAKFVCIYNENVGSSTVQKRSIFCALREVLLRNKIVWK